MEVLFILFGLVWIVYGHLYGNLSAGQTRALFLKGQFERTMEGKKPFPDRAVYVVSAMSYAMMAVAWPLLALLTTVMLPFVKSPARLLYNTYITPWTGRYYAD